MATTQSSQLLQVLAATGSVAEIGVVTETFGTVRTLANWVVEIRRARQVCGPGMR